MPLFDVTKNRHVSTYSLGSAYYFRHFFDDPGPFRELEQYYKKQGYRFRMAIVGWRNRVMKDLSIEGYYLESRGDNDKNSI